MSKARDLGASLLAQKQDRDDKFYKRKRSYEKKLAWASLAVPAATKAISTVLTDKSNTWLANEDLYEEKIQYQLARRNADYRMGIDKKIQESGGSAFEYFAGLDRERTEERTAEYLRAEGMEEFVGVAGPYKAEVTKIVGSWAADRAKEHEEAMKHVAKIGTPEEFAALIELNRKRARPTDPFNALISKATNWFKGRSQEEIDEIAIDAIRNSRIGRDVDAFNIFMDTYNETNNIQRAYDFTTFATNMDMEEDDLWHVIEQKLEYTSYQGKVYIDGYQKYAHKNIEGRVKFQRMENQVIDFADPTKAGKEAVAAMESAFNFGVRAREQLTTEAFGLFASSVRNIEGFEDLTLQTISLQENPVQAYEAIAKLYQGMLANENNLKNEFRDTIIKSQLDIAMSSFLDILATIRDASKGRPAEYERRTEGLGKKFAETFNLILEINERSVSPEYSEEMLQQIIDGNLVAPSAGRDVPPFPRTPEEQN